MATNEKKNQFKLTAGGKSINLNESKDIIKSELVYLNEIDFFVPLL